MTCKRIQFTQPLLLLSHKPSINTSLSSEMNHQTLNSVNTFKFHSFFIWWFLVFWGFGVKEQQAVRRLARRIQ
jgi:hypothetical protein